MAPDPVDVAVVGVGAFGRQHARVYSAMPEARLVAVVDPDRDRAGRVAGEFGCDPVEDIGSLPDSIRAASVAVPTVLHVPVGLALLKRGFDILVEKPLAAGAEGALELVQTAERMGRILQVGHLERFNPAVQIAAANATVPLFFEIHRLSPFSPRSLDIDVVLDLMIHDIDIVLNLAHSPVCKVDASGVPVVSTHADIANARLQFESGCVANLTASRVSTEKVRKLRFFQPGEYVSIDYMSQSGVRIAVGSSSDLRVRPIRPGRDEPLRRQLEAFVKAVRNCQEPPVTGREGLAALDLALRIREAIEKHSRLVSKTLSALS
ncbi:MAG: Gfo/Idh/MocA family oxidoreductase [Bryobacterales bacterium]|nr:Gfo/Idh/MocA family oxidoreductase [Bryobacterales bacterium]